MEIRRRKNQIEISDLDPFLAELLRQIPASANTDGAPAAEQRIFSLPINGNETELCAEWKMYVEPELRRLFQTATQTVGADLEQLNGNEQSLANRTLRIPTKHADAWLSALNQARLVIAAKNNFTELELSDHLRSPIDPPRPELVPGKPLRLSAGIYPPRAGLLSRRAGSNQDSFLAFTMAMRRSLIASEDLAGRRLSANASCKS